MKRRQLPIPTDPQPIEQIPLEDGRPAAPARLWIVLAAIVLWAVVCIIGADARLRQRVQMPAAELAAINTQANALCARHRAGVPVRITLPDGVLTCLAGSPS